MAPTPSGGLPGCETFRDNQCAGNQIETPASFEERRWFTPRPGDADYQPSFQDYGVLSAFARVQYADTSYRSATVRVFASVNAAVGSANDLQFSFDGVRQANETRVFTNTFNKPLLIRVTGPKNTSIDLEPVDFRWNLQPVNHTAGDYRDGQKGAIVEFFGWPHADIEAECAALSKAGYLGAKLFPTNEHVMSYQPFQNVMNPWYFFYQPVSYRLEGRMGSRAQLRSLIATCRRLNVRVYADAVVNHMSGAGNDASPVHRNGNGGSCDHWPNKTSSLHLAGGGDKPATGSSPFYTQSFAFNVGKHTGKPPSQEFPAAAYGPTDFHCERALNSWTDPVNLNAGWLSGLVDLNTEKDYVQERIAAYITDLLSIGFSGVRIDAAKHIKPDDLARIFAKVARNMGGSLPTDFIAWLEVLLGGESDLLMCNPNSGYNYGVGLAKLLAAQGLSGADIDKIKIWNSGYPKEPANGYCGISPVRNAIQNDDADQQNPGSSSRDMGDQGCVLIKGCDVPVHRAFETKLFSSPNGARDNNNDYPIRLILSSYYWGTNGAVGIPDGLSSCKRCTTTCNGCIDMYEEKAFSPTSTGYDASIARPGYTRAHRDPAVIAAMRAWMKL